MAVTYMPADDDVMPVFTRAYLSRLADTDYECCFRFEGILAKGFLCLEGSDLVIRDTYFVDDEGDIDMGKTEECGDGVITVPNRARVTLTRYAILIRQEGYDTLSRQMTGITDLDTPDEA